MLQQKVTDKCDVLTWIILYNKHVYNQYQLALCKKKDILHKKEQSPCGRPNNKTLNLKCTLLWKLSLGFSIKLSGQIIFGSKKENAEL